MAFHAQNIRNKEVAGKILIGEELELFFGLFAVSEVGAIGLHPS